MSNNNGNNNNNNTSTQVANASTNQYLKVNYNNSIKDLLVPTKDTLDQLKESGVVYSAKKLETGTKLNTDLSKTDPFNFDGSTKTGTLGVTGTLPIEHGGTGANSRGKGYQALQSAGTFSGDFNSLTTSGVYWVDLRKCTNTPSPDGVNHGMLEVINNAVIYQRFTCFEYTMYIRTYANSTWQDWVCISSSEDIIGINNGGTGASNSYNAQINLNIVHSHDISASGGQDDWRNKALAQIKENAKAGGFQCGSIGWQGIQYGQYFATTSGKTTDRILALIQNSAGTNGALEVWRYDGGVWNACAVKGASLQTMPGIGYGTASQRPSPGSPGRIYFQKV